MKHVTASESEAECDPGFYEAGTGDLKISANNNHVFSGGGPRFPNGDPTDSVYLYWAASYWQDACTWCALDTMKMYVEQHPYATHYPGEVIDAIGMTWGLAANTVPSSKANRIDHFNWLIKMQPRNMEPLYQFTILATMAYNLDVISLNESANMWYNISLLFPDTGTVNRCWREINSIRRYQKDIPQDTTPFHVLTFPLQPMPGGTAGASAPPVKNVTLSVSGNPITESSIITYDIPYPGAVAISLFDLLGNEIKSMVSELADRDTHVVPFDKHGISAGMYYLRMTYANRVLTYKVVIN
ncbi:MAG TPA: T9SS type A sorting domain-containing protein [Candidatus Kapabacteria bacterium]|nr:T9SS type A sorting domain-containing protein [Candidatus Kapabacteria bacterium]